MANYILEFDDKLPSELRNNLSLDIADYLTWSTYKIKLNRLDIPVKVHWLIKQAQVKQLFAFKCAIRKLGTESWFIIAMATRTGKFNFDTLYVKAEPCKLIVRCQPIIPVKLKLVLKTFDRNCLKCGTILIANLGCYKCAGFHHRLPLLVEHSNEPALTIEEVNQQLFNNIDEQCDQCKKQGLQCRHLIAPPATL